MKISKSLFKNLPKNKYLEKLPDFKSKKAETFTTLTLTFLAFSIFGFFAISPTLSTISQLNKQLEDNKFVEQQLEEKIRNLSLLQQQYALLNTDLSVAFSAIPQSPKVASFVAQVQQIANSSNVHLVALQTFPVELARSDPNSNIERADDYLSFLFTANIEGSYNNISSFLQTLTNFERITTIDSAAFSKNSENVNNLKLSIRGKTYFKK